MTIEQLKDKYVFMKNMNEKDIKHLATFIMSAVISLNFQTAEESNLMTFMSDVSSAMKG